MEKQMVKKERKQRTRITEEIKIQVMLDSDDGYSVREIGERNDISLPTVRKILKEINETETAQDKLEKLLEEQKREKEKIKQRQREGIEAAKAAGKHLGRPKLEKPDNWDIVINSYNNKEITAVEAMERTEVKKSSFYKLLNDDKPKSITINSSMPDYAVNDFDSLLSFVKSRCEVVNNKTNKLEVSMVAERHNMPIDEYIFTKSLSPELMADYAQQEKIVEDYIKTNIKFVNGIPDRDLVVYATGIQSVLAAIIKVCLKLKVNLDVKHYYYYDNGKEEYLTQTIFDKFTSLSDKDYKINKINWLSKLYTNDKLYFYGCTQDDFLGIVNGKKFYVISFNNGTTLRDSHHIICKTYQDAIACYGIMYPAIRNIKAVPTIMVLAEAEYSDNRYEFISNIAKYFNA